MTSLSIKPYILRGLVSILLLILEPVLAKWRFPLHKDDSSYTSPAGGAFPTCPPEDLVLGICNGGSSSDGTTSDTAQTTTRTLSQLLFFWDWQKVKELPGVQLPIKAASWAKSVVLYQPPVGIVTAWTMFHLITSGRLFFWNRQAQKDPRLGGPTAVTEMAAKKSYRLARHYGRALDLDKDDIEYRNFGSVERVRRRLCWEALEEWDSRLKSSEGPDALVAALLKEVMKISFPPGGSHAAHLHELLPSIAEAEHAWMQYNGKGDTELNHLLEIAMQTGENRVIDSLLRLTRDNLLLTSFRLSRTVQHWKKRVQSQTGLWPVVRRFMAGSFEGDRMRLAFAESAYNSEITRVGKIMKQLSHRPEGMDDSFLQIAVQKTYTLEMAEPKPRKQRKWMHLHVPDISKWSIRFNADGRGRIQVQKYEDALRIGGPVAMEVLLDDADQNEWLSASKEWVKQARGMLIDILDETLETSIQANMENEVNLQKLKVTWMVNEYSRSTEVTLDDITLQWNSLFGMVRNLHNFRRVGDGKNVRWKDANLIHYVRQWDLLGIPSAAFNIVLARMTNKRLLMPHWPKVKAFLEETFEIANEIFQTRFWRPVRDLLTELMYRDTDSLLTGLSLQDEETSLDYMLRDLNFGDGTPESRHEAILKATRQYESDMAGGVMRHALGGRLIRLILIQIQQLKVGMLHAVGTVDVLLQTNRFNVQLLAIIPAIVIVTVGTKVFFRSLFTFRHKDLRPMSFVHSGMTGYLNQLESILLLADDQESSESKRKRGDQPMTALEAMSDHELGEFTLNLYDYLVLLDYSSPQPFPGLQCDSIHHSIVEFLGPKGSLSRMGLHDQVRLVDHVKQKHKDLAKHL